MDEVLAKAIYVRKELRELMMELAGIRISLPEYIFTVLERQTLLIVVHHRWVRLDSTSVDTYKVS